jgi:hypothetical protein
MMVNQIRAKNGIPYDSLSYESALTDALYGQTDDPNAFDPRTSALYDGVLKPLVHCGLLDESRANGRKLVERVYSRSPLWTQYLKLDPKQPTLRVVH